MANDQIRMTPETMRTRANEYTTQANNIQDVIQKLDSLLKQLQSEWEGQSSRGFEAKYRELRPGFVKTKGLVDEIAASLKKSAQIIEDADRQINSGYSS